MRVRDVVSCASRQGFLESVVHFVRGEEKEGGLRDRGCGVERVLSLWECACLFYSEFKTSKPNREVDSEMYVRRSGRERKARKVALSMMGAEGWKVEGSGSGKRSWM